MPRDENSQAIVSGFSGVPEFARGMVRELRIRWAMKTDPRRGIATNPVPCDGEWMIYGGFVPVVQPGE
jgi:uncharacterized protein YbaA (DUF1428 family)